MARKGKIVPIILIFVISLQIGFTQETEAAYAIANLVLKTNGGGVRPDYAMFIVDYLRVIGIEVEIKVEEWSVFVGALTVTHDYDLAVIGMTGGGGPDMRNIYTEEGEYNMFGLDTDIPYCSESENMQDVAASITDLMARQQHYWDWQELVMDKIVPILPLYSPQEYVGIWSNIKGYNVEYGLADSLPFMYCEGYHQEQNSLRELNIADSLHNICSLDICDCNIISEVWKAISEPIILYAQDNSPRKSGLVDDWDIIDDTHFKFYMRDNIFWNPSYNITDRTSSSDPIEAIVSSELMKGLRTNEYSDGTNQQVMAKDAVFTFLLRSNHITDGSANFFNWISDLYVDPVDPLAFHILVDEDPVTPEREFYSEFWHSLNLDIFPEFFMNSSENYVSYTPGGVRCIGLYPDIWDTSQWTSFIKSPFGCGKYMLDYADKNSEAVLRNSPYWFGIGAHGVEEELYFELIRAHVFWDSTEILSMFKSGKLDYIGKFLSYFPAEKRQMEVDPRFEIYSYLQKSMTMLVFNLQRPFVGGADNFVYLDTPGKEAYTVGSAIRKAICYAINRVEMNEIIHNGEYVVSHSVMYPYTSYYYYNDIIRYNYDFLSAFEWLGAAGYPFPDLPPCCTTPTQNHQTSLPTTSINFSLSIICFFVCFIFAMNLRKLINKK